MRTIAIAICAILAGSIFIAWAHDYRAPSQRLDDRMFFFSSTLREARVVESVTIDGVLYTVTHGVVSPESSLHREDAVLRLAYEKAAARRNPFMSLSSVDPGEMESAVDELAETARALSERSEDPHGSLLVATSLYPIDFLHAMARLERARKDFLLSGSEAHAFLYRMQLDRTIRAYHANIARYRNAFDAVIPHDAQAFVTPTEIITRESIFNALDTLEAAVKDTAARVAKRHACTRGTIGKCDVEDVRLPVIEQSLNSPPPASARSLAEDIRKLYAEPVGYEMEEMDQPLLLLEKSACLPPREGTGLFFSFRHEPTDTTGFSIPIFVGDVRFIPSAPFSDTPYYRYFAAEGISYVSGSPLTYYTCQEADYDIGALESMRAVRDFAERTRLSAFATPEERRSLEEFEKKTLTASVITENDVDTYLGAASALVGKGALQDSDSNRVIELLLERKNRSIGIYKTILSINSVERMNMRMSDNGVPMVFSPVYVFFSRSAFSALFMQANFSVTGEHARLFLPNNRSLSELPYVFYSDLYTDDSIREELIRGMSFVREIHY